MNSNLPNTQSGQNNPANKIQSYISSGGKETEFKSSASSEVVKIISDEVEIPEEVEKAGVQKISDSIELPPDLKKIGINTGSTSPVTTQQNDPSNIVLPISDQQVIVGLHQNITSAFRWLAVWCIHKLHKAHIMLKVIHGKIKRVKE